MLALLTLAAVFALVCGLAIFCAWWADRALQKWLDEIDTD